MDKTEIIHRLALNLVEDYYKNIKGICGLHTDKRGKREKSEVYKVANKLFSLGDRYRRRNSG